MGTDPARVDLPAPGEAVPASDHCDRPRVRGDRSIGSNNLHGGEVGQTEGETTEFKKKQQKADTVAKLGLMASKEISNSQVELIRLTAGVTNALDAAWGSIDTINHVLLVCNVADKQVGVMESAMQAAMGGHVPVAAFTELNYARVELKINRDARAVGLDPVARHLSDYLQMETSFVAEPAGFSTLVQVSLIDMKSALMIWEHHILPIPLDHVFWKSALIMTLRYPWERAEVDRKKRRAADTTISVSMYLQFTIDFQTNTTCSKSFHIS
jgi:hypothetical protein